MAIKELFEAANAIKVIGTRHGEEQHETLLTREEIRERLLALEFIQQELRGSVGCAF